MSKAKKEEDISLVKFDQYNELKEKLGTALSEKFNSLSINVYHGGVTTDMDFMFVLSGVPKDLKEEVAAFTVQTVQTSYPESKPTIECC